MELKYDLLEHPFYKAWTDGKITQDQLSQYAASYAEFIGMVPMFWKKVIDYFDIKENQYLKIVKEEIWHISLWERWTQKLPASPQFPAMDDLIEEFESMTPSQLLGALYAFESQQPKVAELKKECLKQFYGFSDEELIYFHEHVKEEEHIAFGKALSRVYADQNDYEFGIQKGSMLLYHSLDRFLYIN